MNNRFIKRTLYVLTALFVFWITGCVQSEVRVDTPTPNEGKETRFTVSVPGMRTPSTRTLDGTKEKEVTQVNVVIFSNTDNTILEHHNIESDEITAASGSNDWQFEVKTIENSENITVAIIANAAVEVFEALDAVKNNGTWVGAAKTDFMNALQVANTGKWNTSTSGYWRIPMYGEVVVTGSIYSGNELAITLTRMLAKVDVVNNIAPSGTPSAGTFELTAVHVVNYNTRGYVAPAWNPITGIVGAPASSPNLPTDPGTRTWISGNELTYIPATGANSITDEIYLFESAALSDNPSTPDGLRLVFEGNYTDANGTNNYYYPVDFTAPRSGSSTSYMPVLRNNRYLFTITEASGRGYNRLSEAVEAFGVMSNLKTRLISYDESVVKNITYNGQYMLGVSQSEYLLDKKQYTASASKNKLTVFTDAPSGWKVVKIDDGSGNAVNWLTVSKTSGLKDEHETVYLLLDENDGTASRTAYVYIESGNLTQTIKVVQSNLEDAVFYFIGVLNVDGVNDLIPTAGGDLTVYVETNGAWEIHTSNGGSASMAASALGEKTLTVTAPAPADPWTSSSFDIWVEYEGVEQYRATYTQRGYYITSITGAPSSLGRQGADLPLTFTGYFPDMVVRATPNGTTGSVSETGTFYAEASNDAQNVTIETYTRTAVHREITLEYEKRPGEWVEIARFNQYGNIKLTTGKYLALNDVAGSFTWAGAMGISTYYNTAHFGQPNYTPNVATGCATYYEVSPSDPVTGQGKWHIPNNSDADYINGPWDTTGATEEGLIVSPGYPYATSEDSGGSIIVFGYDMNNYTGNGSLIWCSGWDSIFHTSKTAGNLKARCVRNP